MLVAVPLDGSRADTLRVREDIWTALWGGDGRIYYRVKGEWPDVEGGRDASDPQMSRSGPFIACRGLHGTRIGRLVVEGR